MISRKIDEHQISKAKLLIDNASKVVVVCHMSPDGDAVGSSLAMAKIMDKLGKDVHIVVPDPYLANLKILPGAKEIVESSKYPDFARQLFDEADLIFCLDFNELARVGRLEEILKEAKAPKILIDHHLNPTVEADVVISHPEMSATAYLVFRFLCRLELFNFIDKDIAQCLLAGMMTDTGNFAYNCSDPELFVVVAELIKKGADKEKLYYDLFNTRSANCMRLNAYAILNKMEIFEDYGAALISLSREELNRFHYTKGDTEGLVNRPLAVPGICYSVFLREESNLIRVSMRSLGDFPVNKVCSDHFQGGGHLNAAGGDFYGTLDEAAAYVRSILSENKRKYITKQE